MRLPGPRLPQAQLPRAGPGRPPSGRRPLQPRPAAKPTCPPGPSGAAGPTGTVRNSAAPGGSRPARRGAAARGEDPLPVPLRVTSSPRDSGANRPRHSALRAKQRPEPCHHRALPPHSPTASGGGSGRTAGSKMAADGGAGRAGLARARVRWAGPGGANGPRAARGSKLRAAVTGPALGSLSRPWGRSRRWDSR